MDFQQVDRASKITAVPPPPVNIHVMVVDDDATSLSVLSSLLKTLKYQVASFNDPIRAFHTLRAGKQSFDLIMTALYMSKMDGFELTKKVNDEFKLPVIMISSDDRESVMYRAIQEGVVLYLLKPFSPNDLRNIWQFAIASKTRSKSNHSLLIEETRSCGGVEFRAVNDEAVHSVSASNELLVPEKKKKNSKLGKGGNQEKANNDKKGLTKRKAKVVWTDFLQYRFLQAVHYIGLDRAVPKKILELMNVPGLKRENVASHLQKYRIFLRKVAERCMITSDKKTEEILWSKFLSRHVSLVLQKIQQKRTLQLNSSQNPNIPPFPTPNNGDARSKRRPSSSFAANLLPYGLGHTASLGNFVCPLPMNQNNNNNAQGFNFYGGQLHNLQPFEDYSYLGSSFPGNNYDYYAGFAGGIGGEIPMAQQGISSNGFGQYGTGFGEDNSYNGGLMCNNGVNFGVDSQITAKHSSHDLVNKQQGFMKDHNHQLYNMSTANEGLTTDPFPIDDQVLDEFLASLLRNNN